MAGEEVNGEDDSDDDCGDKNDSSRSAAKGRPRELNQ